MTKNLRFSMAAVYILTVAIPSVRRFITTAITTAITATLLAVAFTSPVYAVSNGTVVMSKGVVTATATDQTNRILGKGADVNEGDTINTAIKSFAVIRMVDKTKFTLKPNTTMILGEFNTTPGKEVACVNLVKGGLRTVTGLIGQRRPDAVQLDTPIASIGIRGTDFITLICQDGAACSGEEQSYEDEEAGSNNDDEQRDSVIESIPQGLYSSCETGTVVVSKCAGQASGYQPGKCRINQQRDCIDVVLTKGQSAYASYGKKEFEEESEEESEQASEQSSEQSAAKLKSSPKILSDDPYFKLSDMSDQELETINLLMEEAGGGIESGGTPGATSCEVSL